MEEFLVYWIPQAVVCSGLAANLARHKGLDIGPWAFAGFFFGVFGLIAAAGMPVRRATREPEPTDVPCRGCREPIPMDARACRHCGAQASAEEYEQRILDAFAASGREAMLATEVLCREAGPAAIEHMRRLVQDASTVDVRVRALSVLGTHRDRASSGLVIALLGDANEYVAAAAKEALKRMATERDVPALCQALVRNPRASVDAGAVLASLGAAAIAPLEATQASADDALRQRIDYVLGLLRDDASVTRPDTARP